MTPGCSDRNWPLDLPAKWTRALGRSGHSVVDMSTTTTRRVKLAKLVPDFYHAMIELDAVSDAGLDPKLAHLVRVRASQLNGCA